VGTRCCRAWNGKRACESRPVRVRLPAGTANDHALWRAGRPFGAGLNPPPSNEDIAAVVAAVLSDPRPHIGKSYRPTGPELLCAEDIARILSRVLGRKVKYSEVSTAMFTKAAIAQGFPLFETSQVRHYLAELRAGVFAAGGPTSHVQELTGRAPESFESTARALHPASLLDPSCVVCRQQTISCQADASDVRDPRSEP
jgi:hypothetical protein